MFVAIIITLEIPLSVFIGVTFDGNYEAMTSDFVYDPDLTRTISVDVRYVLFITEKLGKADNVLKELEIVGGDD